MSDHDQPTDPGQEQWYDLTSPRQTAAPRIRKPSTLQPTKPMPRWLRVWHNRQPVLTTVGVVCFGLFLVTMLCALVAITTRTTEAGTQAPQPTQVVHLATPTPTPTSTPAPTPTARIIYVPVQATPTPSPATPTPLPVTPTPTQVVGINGNPWGYDLTKTDGHLIYNPPDGFCQYFNCIRNFSNGNGYVVKCQDGKYDSSGGEWDSCAWHGGDKQPLYSH